MNAWIETLPAHKVAAAIEKDGERLMRKHQVNDAHFALWLEMVDRCVMRRVGLGYQDMEDWAYRDNYDAGMAPKDAAVEMLQDNGWDEALS